MQTSDAFDSGLLCLYQGSSSKPVASVPFPLSAARTIVSQIGSAQTAKKTHSCPPDSGDRALIYLRESDRAFVYTLRLTGCHALADANHSAYAPIGLIDTINRLDPANAHPAATPGPAVTPS